MITDHNHHISDYISTRKITYYDMQPNEKSGNPDYHKNFQHLVVWTSDFALPSVYVVNFKKLCD